jgi:nicotinamidase-related amidase
MRIVKNNTLLVCIDLQERLIPAMHSGTSAVTEAAKLVKGFIAIGCPVIVTQQYTKGLGDSVSEIKEAFDNFSHIEKSSFSAMGEPDFVNALEQTGRKTVVICGVESHVCVMQSALDMLAAGYEVFLAADAVSSRKKIDMDTAVKRMLHTGIMPATVESVLFELLENDSKSETFKTISRLVK